MFVIQASGDPTKAYTALANVDKAYSTDYDFHVVIYRLASIGACVDTNGRVSLQYSATVVANTGAANISAENISAENISAENISAENGFPSDSTNILNNSVFVPKPSAPTPSSGARLGSAGTVPSGGYRIGEGVEAQPPEREFTVVKLIAIPKKPLSLITTPYNPAANPASLTVSSYWCDQNCAPVAKGPDLVVGAAPVVTPAVVAAGLPVNVDAWSVANVGTVSAGPRRYGYYLSRTTALDLLPTGLVDTSKDVFLGSVEGTIVPLLPGTSETLAPTAVTIPLTTAPGTWYLLLYADDLRTVNELSENNNIVLAASITITADTTPPVIDAHAAVTAEATNPTELWSPVPRVYNLYRSGLAGTLAGLAYASQGRNLRIKPWIAAESTRPVAGPSFVGGADADPRPEVRRHDVADPRPHREAGRRAGRGGRAAGHVTPVSASTTRRQREFVLANTADVLLRRHPAPVCGRAINRCAAPEEELLLIFGRAAVLSRRIGLTGSGQSIPIDAGARLTGRAGAYCASA